MQSARSPQRIYHRWLTPPLPAPPPRAAQRQSKQGGSNAAAAEEAGELFVLLRNADKRAVRGPTGHPHRGGDALSDCTLGLPGVEAGGG